MEHRIIHACTAYEFKAWNLSNTELATVQETDIGENSGNGDYSAFC